MRRLVKGTGPERPSEPIGTTHSAVGVVKWWKDQKGHGAIECADVAPWDVWFHYAQLAPSPSGAAYRALEPGTEVEVDFHRADQESFNYVADAVRRRKK